MKFGQITRTGSAAGLLSMTVVCHAQNAAVAEYSGNVSTLDTVVVTATRQSQPLDEASHKIVIVDDAALQTMQPESVAQAVDHAPNITTTGGPRSGNQSVNIRGLEGEKVLQVVDGVRQDFRSGHRPSYFLDPALIRQVEVVKWPASAIWGSGPIGGVVSQATIRASDVLSADANAGGLVKSSYNSNNDKQTQVAALAARTAHTDWLVSGYLRDGNNLQHGDGTHLSHSAQRDHGALAKVEWQITEAHAVAASFRQSSQAGSVPSNGAAGESSSSFVIDRDTSTKNALINYRFEPISGASKTDIKLFRNEVEMQESRLSDGRADRTEVDVTGLMINHIAQLDAIALFVGIDASQEAFTAQRSGSDRPTPPEAKTTIWGAYASAATEVAQDVRAELGLRFDQFDTQADNLDQATRDQDVSPSVALIWQATRSLQFTLRHDQAFRAPGSEELYTSGTHFCMGPGFCNTFVPNPDLKAEQATNSELIVRWASLPQPENGRWSAEVSIFENRVDDFIEQVVTAPSFFPIADAGTTTWINLEEATIRGVELKARYETGALAVELAHGTVRGKNDRSGQDLSNIPADKTTVSVRYEWLPEVIETGVRLSKTEDQYRVNVEGGSTQPFSGYSLVDVFAQWSPRQMPNLRIDVTANNIFDRHYRQAWQQLDAAGRELIVAATFRF